MKKRVLSLMLALVMALGMAAPAFAADEFAVPEEGYGGYEPAPEAPLPEEPAPAEEDGDVDLPAEPVDEPLPAVADEPMAAALVDEPMPAVDEPYKLNVSFRQEKAQFDLSGSDISGTDRLLWVSSGNSAFKLSDQYDYELTYPGGGPLKPKYFRSTGVPLMFWQLPDGIQEGDYTVTAYSKDEPKTMVARGTTKIFKIVFDPGTGNFSGSKTPIVKYGTKDTLLSTSFTVPKPTPAEDSGAFLGWGTGEKTVWYAWELLGKDIEPPDNTYTAEAVYGTALTYKYDLSATGATLQNNSSYYTCDITDAAKGAVLTVENTGTGVIDSLSITMFPSCFDREASGIDTFNTAGKLEVGGTRTLKLQPKSDLSVGKYEEQMCIARGRYLQFVHVKFTVLAQNNFTIEVEPMTKTYGQELSVADAKIRTGNKTENYTWLTDKGYWLDSDGFDADADIGSHDITLHGQDTTDYMVTLTGDPKVTVGQATPVGKGVPTAIEVGEGSSVADKLTGTFYNSHHFGEDAWKVEGTLSWEDSEAAGQALAAGGYTFKWNFSPEDHDHYANATGEVKVTATKLEPTNLTPVKTIFEYNGQPQKAEFKADRDGAIKVEYRDYNYSDDWTIDAPSAVGTYRVKASIPATNTYAAAELESVMAIEPKTLALGFSDYGSKTYDGTTAANPAQPSVSGRVGTEDVSVKLEAEFLSKNAGIQNVIVTVLLEGTDAGNYRLEKTRYNGTATISTKKIKVNKQELEKTYGQLLILEPEQFVDGIFHGDETSIGITCAGATADAGVKESPYSITAECRDGNYRFEDGKASADAGSVTVNKATPVQHVLNIGDGSEGHTLREVPLSGEFRNPYSDAAVAGTLKWEGEEHKFAETEKTYSATWIFEPEDMVNYNSVSETVTVNVRDDNPLPLVAPAVTVEYDGKEHAYDKSCYSFEGGFNGPVDVEVMYRPLQETVRTPAEEDHDSSGWTTAAPVNAGTYEVHLLASDEGYEGYADRHLHTDLTITKATPDKTGVATEMEVEKGTVLRKVSLANPTGVEGSAVSGAHTWDAPDTVINEAGTYGWIFVPSGNDAVNYTTVTGTVAFTVKGETKPEATPEPTATPAPVDPGPSYPTEPDPTPTVTPTPTPTPGTTPEPGPGTTPTPAPTPVAPPASGTGWTQNTNGDWFYYENSTPVKSQWRADGNTWNFLGSDGKMVTGLQEIRTGESYDGWYYLNPKHDGTFGNMQVGWWLVDGDWYYFNEKHDGKYGIMIHNDWKADGNTWNYLGDDGKMVTGLRWVNDGTIYDGLYYLNPFHDGTFGNMLVGWHTIDGYRYFFENRHNGLYGIGYVNGTFTIGGRSYTFDEHGRLVN